MWYATITETRQTIPPSKPDAEPPSEFPVDQSATAELAVTDQGVSWHKAEPYATESVPGSEYWLP
jgi:hypothetical protein